MKLYTTVRENLLNEYLGEGYNSFKQVIENVHSRKDGWLLEKYYHQEVKTDDLFLMVPHFSQVNLVSLLTNRGYTPLYVTIAKEGDIAPHETFYEDIGVVCDPRDIATLIPFLIESAKIGEKYSCLSYLFSQVRSMENVLGSLEKKSEDSATFSLVAANNPSYTSSTPELMYGTRSALETNTTDGLFREYPVRYFQIDDEHIYIVFGYYEAYCFKSCSTEEKTLDIINRYVAILEKISGDEDAKIQHNKRTKTEKPHKVKKDDEALLKEAVQGLKDHDIERVNSKESMVLMQITLPKFDFSFSGIPLTDKEVYSEFRNFIMDAISGKKIYRAEYDPQESEILFSIANPSQWKRHEFYLRYTLFFVSQYTQEMLDKSNEISGAGELFTNTAKQIIYTKWEKDIAGTELLLSYYGHLEKYEKKEEKTYAINPLIDDLKNINPKDIFSSSAIELLGEYQKVLQSKLTEKKSLPETEFSSMTQAKIAIQNYLCDKKNKCFSEESDRKKVCVTRGKKFQAFEDYLDENNTESLYHQLPEKCRKKVDEYFGLSITYIEEYDFDINAEEEIEIEVEDESTVNQMTSDLEVLVRFLLSYNSFGAYPSMRFYLKTKPFIQIFFSYMDLLLKGVNSDANASHSKAYIRNLLAMLGREKQTIKHLGEVTYYKWMEEFYLLLSTHDIVTFIYEKSDSSSDIWSEIETVLKSPLSDRLYNESISILPKDVRLEQKESRKLFNVYLKAISDVYQLHCDNGNPIEGIAQIVEKLNEVQIYPLFSTFLTKDKIPPAMELYLEKVVYMPNKEDYLSCD